MGEVRNVGCDACGKVWRCITGNGLLYSRKESIVAAFLEEEWERVSGMLADSGIPAYDFQYHIAVCGHCHNVVSVPALALSEQEKPYVGLCPICRQQAGEPWEEETIEERGKNTSCPVCGNRGLWTEEGGSWD